MLDTASFGGMLNEHVNVIWQNVPLLYRTFLDTSPVAKRGRFATMLLALAILLVPGKGRQS